MPGPDVNTIVFSVCTAAHPGPWMESSSLGRAVALSLWTAFICFIPFLPVALETIAWLLQRTYCRTLPPTIWVTRRTPECFLTLFCSRFPTSLALFLTVSPIQVTFPLPRFSHNLCLLFWCRAFSHYFPLGIIAAGAMNGGYSGTAGGTFRRRMHNCTDVAVYLIADVISIHRVLCGSQWPPPPSVRCSHQPSPWSVLQPHLLTSHPVNSDAVHSPGVSSKLAIGFQKATLVFFLPFPFLSSTSKSTLLLTSVLPLCLTASLPHVKMSASAWQDEDAY